jgi:ABC-type glycerol-3-phosphate transport system substrate-binding protein
MMKKFFAVILAALMLVSVVGCTGGKTTEAPKKEQGKVFNIYAWNEEFKGFFEKYYKVPEGVTVNWIINPSDNGVYQQKLDEALLNQASAKDDDKIDMFLIGNLYHLRPVLGKRDPASAFFIKVLHCNSCCSGILCIRF